MLTVVLATKNRAHLLGRVLDAFAALHAPEGGWKLVVIDNGSTDSTAALLDRYRRSLPLTVIREPRSGMNAALNAALPAVEGDLMVKTDDDVLPAPGWLAAYRRAADANPERTLFGGTVEPEWPDALPDWLTSRSVNFGILYAQVGRPAGPCPFSGIYGPNWAVRSAVFAAGMRFDEQIGPDSTRQFYPMGGETEFFARLEAQGHLGWFVPDAALRHIVRPEQLEEGWILDRAYRNGLGVGLTRLPDCARGLRLAGRPAGVLIRLAIYRSLAMVARPLTPSPLRLRILFQESWFTGLLDSFGTRSAGRMGEPLLEMQARLPLAS